MIDVANELQPVAEADETGGTLIDSWQYIIAPLTDCFVYFRLLCRLR